jgi:hypothetical protein
MNIVPLNAGLLKLTIKAQSGVVYDVDLSEFAVGGNVEQVVPKAKHAWAGDFDGRPLFAMEIAELLQRDRLEPRAAKAVRHSLRGIFRFFDAVKAKHGSNVTCIADVTDGHGPMMLEWLAGENTGLYRHSKTILDALRSFRGVPPLFWPARASDNVSAAEPVDTEAVRHLFNAFKREARCIKQMFAEGERLADEGQEPSSSFDQLHAAPGAAGGRHPHADPGSGGSHGAHRGRCSPRWRSRQKIFCGAHVDSSKWRAIDLAQRPVMTL